MFKILTHIASFFFILLVFNSCGKDNDSNLPASNTLTSELDSTHIAREVKLISPKTISIYENQAGVVTLFAVSKNNITYSINEGDSESFDLNTKSGVVTFKVAPDYESKKIYTFRAKATDDKENSHAENIVINILDLDENIISTNNIKRVFYVGHIYRDGEVPPEEENPYYDPRYRPAPNQPTVQQPTVQQPTVQQPTVQQPTVQQPIAGQPTVQQPIVQEPTIQELNNLQNIQEELRGEIKEVEKIYIRDNSNNVVMDNTTKMTWQDDNSTKTIRMTWDEAVIYCENISLGGHSDWRLPTLRELHGIMDNKKSNRSTSDVFKNLITRNYWISTESASNPKNAWTTNLYHGNTYPSDKHSLYYVTCTRDVE